MPPNTIFYRSRRAWKRWRRSAARTAALIRRCTASTMSSVVCATSRTGVLAGSDQHFDIISRKEIGGEIVPCEGELYYRGIRIQDLVQGFIRTAARVMRRLPICCCSVSCRMPSVWAISRSATQDARRPISPVMSS